MNIQYIEADQFEAREKYKEYRAALKVERNKQIAYLATIYWQLSRGRKVIDAVTAITSAGLNAEGHPKLAIAEAHQPNVAYQQNSERGTFYHGPRMRSSVLHFERPGSWPNRYIWAIEAPLPIIPPSHIPPDYKLDNLHILWEVEKWAKVPSTDPLLLRRLSGPFFVVLAAWNLTPAEQAVMAAGLRM